MDDVQLGKGSTFTQEDIDSGRVSYEHDGSATTADGFTYDVADAEGVKVSDQGFTVFTFRIAINATTVGVIDRAGIPEEYALEANYPNPFNPSTTIRYQLPAAGYVSLMVYDLTGKLIRTLVSAARPAGYHRAVWDGTDQRGATVATGVYFYRIAVDNAFVQTRKMVLMK